MRPDRVFAFALAISLVAGPTLAASRGKASYYDYRGTTASGKHARTATAAHRTLPFGTRVKVTNVHNGKSTQVIIEDRGPYAHGRLIDVSPPAAETLGFKKEGVTDVALEVVSAPDDHSEVDLTK